MGRLYKSRTERMVDGVCGGIATYFNTDPIIIRLIWVVGTFFSGLFLGVAAYLIAMMVMPREPKLDKTSEFTDELENMEDNAGDLSSTTTFSSSETDHLDKESSQSTSEKKPRDLAVILGLGLIIFGIVFLFDKVPGINWRFFRSFSDYFWPVLLIGIGLLVLNRRFTR